MPSYMLQLNYSADSWANLAKNPQDREVVARELVKGLGGDLQAFYFTFGDYDAVLIYSAADAETAAGVAMALVASGAMKTAKTTPLLSASDAMKAMTTAGQMLQRYRRPGQ